jgi:DNA-binding transcriptional LysR family regulator
LLGRPFLEDGAARTTRVHALFATPGAIPSDGVLGLLYSAKAGIGIAPLPTAQGDAEADLVRVLGPVDALTRIWRVLTTPELRHTPAVEAFFDFLTEDVERLRPIITG